MKERFHILIYYTVCGVRNTRLPGFELKNSCSLKPLLGAATQLFLFGLFILYLYIYLQAFYSIQHLSITLCNADALLCCQCTIQCGKDIKMVPEVPLIVGSRTEENN